MKKSYLILLVLISVILLTISNNLFKENQVIEAKAENTKEESSGLAIMLENDKGEYELSTSDTWPTEEYEFNATLSKCENGGTVSWKDGRVLISTSSSDKCYVYFNKYIPPTSLTGVCPNGGNFVDCIKTLQEKNPNQEETGIYFHDNNLANGAQDNSYRFAGINPNNFVCFGPGAEIYTGTSGNCKDENLYRIIGVFGDQVKLIQNEYATHDQLGIDSEGTASTNSFYARSLARVTKTSEVESFQWNNTSTGNEWSSSTLKTALNDESKGYLYYLGTWANKIATSTWYVGGCYAGYDFKATPKEMYDYEAGNSKSGKNVEAKIGLMYASDYGFATITEYSYNWQYPLNGYSDATEVGIIATDWLFTGVAEWTISPDTTYMSEGFYIGNEGAIMRDLVSSTIMGVRPAFYLESSVNLTNVGDGSASTPYKIE